MRNAELAKIFYEIADMLELQGVQWKPAAYRKAAQTIEALSEDIEDYVESGKKLTDLPGIGERIAEKIVEFIKTGKVHHHEKLKKEFPFDLEALTSIPGMGPKKAKKLFDELGVKGISDLKKAAQAGRVAGIQGFGEKSEQEILRGIKLLEKSKGRVLLGYVIYDGLKIVEELKASKLVGRAELAGSARRWRETVGDFDILAASNVPGKVMDFFCELKEVDEVVAKGSTKSSVRLKTGLDCDLRVVREDEFGSALQYFTGSKQHNIALRKIAIKKGFKLSEYGVFEKKSGKKIAGKTEEEVYKVLGLRYIEPELRENSGEIEAAIEGKLPKLVESKELRGDLHVHSNWSDGSNSILEIAKASEKLGYEYVGLADHAGKLKIAGGLDEKQLEKRSKEIEKINAGEKLKTRVLNGCEVDIDKNGGLAVSSSALKKLDLVVAAVHSSFKMPKERMTKRLCDAMESGCVHVLAHPTGRMIGSREAYDVDFDELFDVAKRMNTALEINAYPERLDLNDANARDAVKDGCTLAIGTDAHSTGHLHFLELGVRTARRGWCEKKHLLNCLSLRELEKKLKK